MKIKFALFALFSAIYSLAFSQPTEKSSFIADFNSYIKLIQKKHANPFNWTSKEKFLAEADSLKKSAPNLSLNEFIVGFYRINALLKDEHTQLDIKTKTIFPVYFSFFEEGVFPVSTLSDYSSILGLQLLSINGVPVDSVIGKFKSLTAVNTPTGYLSKYPYFLYSPVVLNGLHIIPSDTSVNYTFRTITGDTTVSMQAVDRSQGGFEVLQPEKPFLYAAGKSSYWLKYDESRRFLYIYYGKCAEDAANPFSDFQKSVTQIIQAKKPEKVIIDLRFNGGGNTGVFKPLAVALAYMPELKDKKIYTLIGRRTFSAAVVNTYQLKNTAHAILVGEETGGKLNHAGSVRSFKLKETGTTVYYSFYDYYYDSTIKGGMMPDIPVKYSINDYRKGTDAMLEKVLSN